MAKLRLVMTQVRYRALAALAVRMTKLTGSLPIVSFTFDDFPRSALSVGGEILSRYGVRGTYYASIGLMNRCNALGQQFTPEDLARVLQDGHELASHTYSHISSATMSGRVKFLFRL